MQIPKIDFTDPVADQEIVIKGPNDCPKREPAPVMLHIPYIINQLFPTKVDRPPLDSPMRATFKPIK